MINHEIFEQPFSQETGADTGDHRENDPQAPGFTPEEDRLWRSHFQHANQIADRSYRDVRPAFELGRSAAADPSFANQTFAEIEEDLENGWLNVRTEAGGTWESVRDYARTAFESARGARPGFIAQPTEARSGGTDSDRPTYRDPLSGRADPTAPDSPEQTLLWQQHDGKFTFGLGSQGGFGDRDATGRDADAPADGENTTG